MTKAKYGNMSDFAILVNLIANKVNIEILKLLGLKHIQLRIKNLMQTAIHPILGSRWISCTCDCHTRKEKVC